MNRVKHFLILALTLTMSLGAWAQNNNTVPVTQDNNLDWNFTMPDYNAQVNVEYYNGYVLTLACNGGGTVEFSGDTLPQGVTAVPGSTANNYYVVSGTEVTVKARANENYGIENWTNENSSVMGTNSTLTITITGDTTLTANFVRDFEGSGTENDPYLIPNTEKWTLLSNRVKEGKGYYGKYFLQTDSIFAGKVCVGTYNSVTSYSRPFGGIYDGGGHVLEFLDVTLSNKNRAPFICVDGATIRNLHVTGTIKTYNNYIAGFIARTVTNNRTTTIINCRSSIRIESLRPADYDGTHGGFVAVTDAAVNLIGCVFDGALIGAKTRSSGGFIGWTEKKASVNFIDCIFAPDSLSMGDSLSCTFSRARRDTSLHFTNCYYAQAFGKEQGKKLRSITAGADVTTLGLAGTATVYNVSGITAYAGNNGLKYGDMFFAGDTDVVNLTLGHADRSAEGMIFDSYSASNGASFNGDTLTMANDSTVVSANYIQNLMLTLNSDGNGTVGFCGDTLPQGVTPGSTANTYYVVSGTEVCIKATPAEHNYMQKWNSEAALNSNEAVNTSFTVTKDTTLTAYFVQKPILTLGTNPSNPIRGTVTIAGNSLPNYVAQIGTSNSYYVDYDSSVTVVATPIEHYHLASWGNTGGNDLQQVVTMTQDMEVTGVFAIDTFTLTLKTNDINMGTVAVTNHNGNPAIVSHDPDANGTRTYKVNYGTEVIIKATPKEHYHLDSWSNGVTVNTDDTIHVIVTTDSTIMATFDTNTYVLNVVSADAAMGSVSGSNPAAKHFLSYEISAIPGPDYRFERWNDGNTNNPRTVTLTSDSNFTAYFAPNSYTITYMDGQTELNVDTFDYRQPIREYTTSKDGWHFEGWNPEVPQLMPAENLVVYAQWSRICEPVTDVDHNTYPTVGIGSICWMAENLRTTHYADGREITHIYEYQSSGYPNVQENVSTYGRLYDWYDAADSARPTRAVRVQGICPDGWYLPNEGDFELLNNVNLTTLRSTNYWLFNPGTNTTGYDLRPAGMYNFATSRYEDLRGNAYLWSVSSVSTTEAHCHMADCHCYMIIDLISNKQNAFSVRCVKD